MTTADNTSEKIIIKKKTLPGVNLAMIDLGMLSTVMPKNTRVTKSINKKNGSTFISTKSQLETNDIIQTGNFKIKYRVISQKKTYDYNWFTYKIKRIDNNSTTSVDIDNSKKGDFVLILNRKTFQELFLEYPHTDLEKIGSMRPKVKNKKSECESCE